MSKLRIHTVEAAAFAFAIFEDAETAVGLEDTTFRFAQSHGSITWSVEWAADATIERWTAAVQARPHTLATFLGRERAHLGDREGWKAAFDIMEEGVEVHGSFAQAQENGPARLTAWGVPHRGQFVLAVVRRPVDFGTEDETALTKSFKWG